MCRRPIHDGRQDSLSVADLGEPCPLGGIRPQERAPDTGVLVDAKDGSARLRACGSASLAPTHKLAQLDAEDARQRQRVHLGIPTFRRIAGLTVGDDA